MHRTLEGAARCIGTKHNLPSASHLQRPKAIRFCVAGGGASAESAKGLLQGNSLTLLGILLFFYITAIC
jgi:hypothetical protein